MDVNPREKEEYVDKTIENDLRFFDIRYAKKQAEIYDIKKQMKRNNVKMELLKRQKIDDKIALKLR